MRCGIQACNNIDIEAVKKAGFNNIELVEGIEIDYKAINAAGIEISGLTITEDSLVMALQKAKELDLEYILINTDNISESDKLMSVIENVSNIIEDLKINIVIQNGMIGDDEKGYRYGAFSDSDKLIAIVNYGNRLCEGNLFKIAVDVGRGNLLEKNISTMIMEMKEHMYLLHVNDNDGKKNLEQMPFTFTTGRGLWSTDWNKIWAAVLKCEKLQWLIFNTVGLYERVPRTLLESMLTLQKAIYDRWMWQMNFEDILKGKRIILFGTGGMATNFIRVWGDKYKPEFLVDNNQSRWGVELLGCEIKAPDKILDIPEEQRLVLICNMYYNEVKTQLTAMNVKCETYNDEFYWFG